MNYNPELFQDDYNLDALQRIRPRGHQFEMFVTPRFTSHYSERQFEPLTSALISAISRRKKVFIDVGANYGFYTILAGRQNSDLEIHALEPIPENMEILRRNLEINDLPKVRCLEKAASDRVGKARFLKSRAADNSGFHIHPDAPPMTEIEVETLPLSLLLRSHRDAPILIKIDTEGHEVPILTGLRKSLSPAQDATLIVEFNPVMQEQAGRDPDELLALLDEMEFAVFLIQEDKYQLIRVDERNAWHKLIQPNRQANLYCRPQQSALSICFFSHSHALAGAERSLAELVGQLVEDYGTVCNVVIPGDGPLHRKVREAGAGVISTAYGWWCGTDPIDETTARHTFGDDLVRLLVQTVPEVDTVRPDLICTNSLVIPFGAITASILRLPHVWNAHEYGHGYHFFIPFEQVLEFVRSSSDFVFGPSKTLLQELFPDLGEERSNHLYPAIEAPASPPTPAVQTTTASPAPVRLLDLSTLTPRKHQETAIRAVAELARRGMEATLLLKGPQDSDYVSFLKRLSESLDIADRIVIEGYTDDVWPEIDGADVIVVSAPAHAFGRIAAEGMLRAKPVIYPRRTSIAEYMEDGRAGLSFVAGDHREMADKIERLIQDPELRRKMGATGQASARRVFHRHGFGGKFLHQAVQLKQSGPQGRRGLPPTLMSSLVAGIQRLDRQRSEFGVSLRSRSRELASVKELAAARDEELRVLKPLIEARNEELAASKQELASVESALAAREEELASVKPALAAREEELASVKPALAAREEELASVKPALAAREEELASVKPALAAREEELAATKPVLEAREEEITNLERSLKQCTEEIRNLRDRLEEAEGLLARIQTSQLGRLALWVTRGK